MTRKRFASVDYHNVFDPTFVHQIGNHSIVAVHTATTVPEDEMLDRAGILWVMLPEEGEVALVWISVQVGGGGEGIPPVFEWYQIASGEGTGLPSSIVHDDVSNNFTHAQQTILDQDIVSVTFNHEQPTQEMITRGDGQLHIQASGSNYILWACVPDPDPDLEDPDADPYMWTKLSGELVDTHNFAKLNQTNIFSNTVQLIGDSTHVRMIGGTRIKTDGITPPFDPEWHAVIEGEQTIVYHPDNAITIWTAIKTKDTEPLVINQWRKTYDSNFNPDLATIARTNKVNLFEEPQRVGSKTDMNPAWINGVTLGNLDPTSTAHADVYPKTAGELYIRDYLNHETQPRVQIFIATRRNDPYSWYKLWDIDEDSNELLLKIEALEDRCESIETKAREHDTGIQNLSESVVELDHDITDLDTRIKKLEDGDVESPDLTNLEARVTANEQEIEEIHTNHNQLNTRMGEAEGNISELELFATEARKDIDASATHIAQARGDIVDIISHMDYFPDPRSVSKGYTTPLPPNHFLRANAAGDGYEHVLSPTDKVEETVDRHEEFLVDARKRLNVFPLPESAGGHKWTPGDILHVTADGAYLDWCPYNIREIHLDLQSARGEIIVLSDRIDRIAPDTGPDLSEKIAILEAELESLRDSVSSNNRNIRELNDRFNNTSGNHNVRINNNQNSIHDINVFLGRS